MDQPASASSSPDRQTWRRVGPIALIATALPILGTFAVPACGLMAAPWLRAQGPAGAVIFVAAFVVLGAIAVAPTYSSSIIAGWTFGFRTGFAAVMIGTVIGATICYLTARRLAADRVHSLFDEHTTWELIRRALVEEGPFKAMWIVFLLRLSPVLPFGTTNILMATTGVPLWPYLAGTVLGLAPRLGLVAFAASRAERLDFKSTESWLMFGAGIIATGFCILVLALLGRRALQRAVSERSSRMTATPVPSTSHNERYNG